MLSVARTVGQAGPIACPFSSNLQDIEQDLKLTYSVLIYSRDLDLHLGVLLLYSHSNLCLLEALCSKVFGPLVLKTHPSGEPWREGLLASSVMLD